MSAQFRSCNFARDNDEYAPYLSDSASNKSTRSRRPSLSSDRMGISHHRYSSDISYHPFFEDFDPWKYNVDRSKLSAAKSNLISLPTPDKNSIGSMSRNFDMTLELLKEYVHSIKDFSSLLKLKEQSCLRDSSTSPITTPSFETNLTININPDRSQHCITNHVKPDPKESHPVTPDLLNDHQQGLTINFIQSTDDENSNVVEDSGQITPVNEADTTGRSDESSIITRFTPNRECDNLKFTGEPRFFGCLPAPFSSIMTQSDYSINSLTNDNSIPRRSTMDTLRAEAAFHRPLTQLLWSSGVPKDVERETGTQQSKRRHAASTDSDCNGSRVPYCRDSGATANCMKVENFSDISSESSVGRMDDPVMHRTEPRHLPVVRRTNVNRSSRQVVLPTTASEKNKVGEKLNDVPSSPLQTSSGTRSRTVPNRRWSHLGKLNGFSEFLKSKEFQNEKLLNMTKAFIPVEATSSPQPSVTAIPDFKSRYKTRAASVSPTVQLVATERPGFLTNFPGKGNDSACVTRGGPFQGFQKQADNATSNKMSDAVTQTQESSFSTLGSLNAPTSTPETSDKQETLIWPLSLQSIVKPTVPPPTVPVQIEISKDVSVPPTLSSSKAGQNLERDLKNGKLPKDIGLSKHLSRRLSLRAFQPVGTSPQEPGPFQRLPQPKFMRNSTGTFSTAETSPESSRCRSVHFSSDVLVAHSGSGPEPLIISSARLKEPALMEKERSASNPFWSSQYARRSTTIPSNWMQSHRFGQNSSQP